MEEDDENKQEEKEEFENEETKQNPQQSADNQEKLDKLNEKLTLIHSEADFKDAFEKRAKEGFLDVEAANDVIDDWSIGLEMDCEPAKRYFDRETSPIAPGQQFSYNQKIIEDLRDKLDYNGFINIFQKWLENEVYEVQAPQEKGKENDLYWFNGSEQNTNPTQQKTEQKLATEASDIRDKKSHDSLIKSIFEVKEKETREMFDQYAQLDGQQNEDKSKLTIDQNDFPLLLKNLLYNMNASLYEKDGEDFFQRNNTYKDLKQFLQPADNKKQSVKPKDWNQSPQSHDALELGNDQRITYEEFKKVSIHFIQSNPELIIMQDTRADEKKGKQEKEKTLEEELLSQIEKYQVTLSNTHSEIEKQVVRNMITTLVKQLDVIREATIKEESSIINASQATQKKKLQISFTGIARPEGKKISKEEFEEMKFDKQFQEIFLFFCKQQYVNGTQFSFDRYSKESQTLSLGMYLYFCHCFGLIQEKFRVPYDTNDLEKKRRGIVDAPKTDKKPKEDKKDENKKDTIKDQVEENPDGEGEGEGGSGSGEGGKQELSNKLDAKPKLVEKEVILKGPPKRKEQLKSIPSKFQWWNDEVKFEKYYTPSMDTSIPEKPKNFNYLTKLEVQTLFKKSSFGKDLDYEEFKQMLAMMAHKMFYNPEHPEIRVYNAYEQMVDYLQVKNPDQYRKNLQPMKLSFNCAEKVEGFREPEWKKGQEYKGRVFTGEEKEKLRTFKEERESYLKEKLSDIRSNANQSLLSVGSLGNISISSQVKSIAGDKSKLNYLQAQSKNARGKVDLNREKISWDKLDHINFNDIQGVNAQQFRPQDLIDDINDDDDKFFLQEFGIAEPKTTSQQSVVDQKRSLEKYGSLKPTLRPTQQFILDQQSQGLSKPPLGVMQSQPQLNKKYQLDDSSAGRYGNPYDQKYNQYKTPQQPISSQQLYQPQNNHSSQLKNQYLQRANQIQQIQNQREQQLMQHLEQEQARKVLVKPKQNKAY